MLPFLKNKQEGSMSSPVEAESEFGTLDAVAQDMLAAFESKDAGLLKSALQAFKDSLQEEDIEQDSQLLTNEE